MAVNVLSSCLFGNEGKEDVSIFKAREQCHSDKDHTRRTHFLELACENSPGSGEGGEKSDKSFWSFMFSDG